MSKETDEKLEEERLSELKSFEILDTPSEKIYDQITSLASVMCDTPIALVSLVDKDRQWFKSTLGLDATETPRSVSFCSHAILQEDIMEIKDATLDERFKNNPLVKGDPNIKFYAGAPLITPRGHRVGTLCVIDSRPHELTPEQKNGLKILARQVVDQLELKKLNAELTYAKDKLVEQQELLVNKARLQSIGELASGICHQINNPLAIIIGKSMILKSMIEHDSSPQMTKMLKELEAIDQTTLRVSEILKTLRTYSKEMGNAHTECTLEELVHDALILTQGKMQSSDITLSYESEDAPKVRVNKNQVTQVILNLLSNSIEAMEGKSDKKITLKVWSDKENSFLDISDTGSGIDNEKNGKVFEPFFTTKSRHFGIGLSSAQNFMEEHEGELIHLEGWPTKFRIRLPKVS